MSCPTATWPTVSYSEDRFNTGFHPAGNFMLVLQVGMLALPSPPNGAIAGKMEFHFIPGVVFSLYFVGSFQLGKLPMDSCSLHIGFPSQHSNFRCVASPRIKHHPPGEQLAMSSYFDHCRRAGMPSWKDIVFQCVLNVLVFVWRAGLMPRQIY